MIINKSGILIRLNVSEVRVMGRATQGVRLINLTKKNDTIASVCKVQKATEEELAEENAEYAETPEASEPSETPENKDNNNTNE
jgi:DNA gyrase subunit A